MTPQLPLIVSQQPVKRLGPIASTDPNRAVVYATPTGQAIWLRDRFPSLSDQFLGRYSNRYEVDMSDHRRMARLESSPLPCRDQVHRFEAGVDIGFRVHDPAEIVRRNIQDALVVVYGHIADVLRRLARGFAIDAAARAEAEMNRHCSQPMPLAEGITIYRCVVELHPDEAARRYLASITKAERDRVQGQAKHTAAVAGVRSDNEIEALRQRGRLEREQAEQAARLEREKQQAQALVGTQFDFEGLIRRHLTVHPEDTLQAMELLSRQTAATADRLDEQLRLADDRFRFMVERDLIQPADVEAARQQMLHQIQGQVQGQIQGAPAAQRPAAALPPVYWGGAQVTDSRTARPDGATGPGATGSVTTGVGTAPGAGTASAPAGDGGAGGGDGAGRGVLPVYVVLDESPAVASCVQSLGNSLRSLHTALLTAPELGSRIRLGVLTVAEDTRVGLPLCQVDWNTRMPAPAVRGGARYGSAYGTLRELLPVDIERLKAQISPVHRPLVFMLTAGVSEDGSEWSDRLAELTDPATTPYYPTIIAVGIGRADERATAAAASRPELGFLAEPDTDAASAAEAFATLLHSTVRDLGRGLAAGRLELAPECPSGLRRLAD